MITLVTGQNRPTARPYIKHTCPQCGGQDVELTLTQRWSVDLQCWFTSGSEDGVHCPDCGEHSHSSTVEMLNQVEAANVVAHRMDMVFTGPGDFV